MYTILNDLNFLILLSAKDVRKKFFVRKILFKFIFNKYLVFDSPPYPSFFPYLIICLSALLQTMVGKGLPLALQDKVTFNPSRTSTALLFLNFKKLIFIN